MKLLLSSVHSHLGIIAHGWNAPWVGQIPKVLDHPSKVICYFTVWFHTTSILLMCIHMFNHFTCQSPHYAIRSISPVLLYSSINLEIISIHVFITFSCNSFSFSGIHFSGLAHNRFSPNIFEWIKVNLSLQLDSGPLQIFSTCMDFIENLGIELFLFPWGNLELRAVPKLIPGHRGNKSWSTWFEHGPAWL